MTKLDVHHAGPALPPHWEADGRSRRREARCISLAWRMILAVGLAAALLHPRVEPAFWSDVAYFAIATFAVGGSFAGVRLNRPYDAEPWITFALAQLTLVMAGLAQAATDNEGYFARHINLADALYGIAYFLLFLALFGLIRGREGKAQRSGLLDSLIVVTGLVLIGWQFLVVPTFAGMHGLPQLLRTLYPIADLLMIGMLVWLSTAPEVRSASFRFLLAGMVIWAIADASFHLTSMGSGEPRAWMKSSWLVAHVCFAAGTLHPSMHALQAPRDAEHTDISASRVALLLAAALSIPGVIAAQLLMGGELRVVAVIYAGVAIIILLWLRIRRLLYRMQAQGERLKELAQTDFLTGLPNRRRLVKLANAALGGRADMVGLLSIDIDRFKGVNDTFGHHVGDRLICALAERWSSGMEPGDVLARTGGDEFVLLVTQLGSRNDAVQRAWRLQALLSEPLELEGLRLNAAASIGVAVSPADGTDLEQLLKRSNWAMRAAKRRQSRVESHTSRSEGQDSWRLLLLNEFRDALKRNELILYYQPKVHLPSGLVIGVEALVRWQHPEHGLLQPAAFLPSIEQTEMIRDLTASVLQQAVAQCVAWRHEGTVLSVAINLSARNIPDLDLVESVHQCLTRYGLPASSLELEITESSAMADPVNGLKTLHALEKLGVLLSVDDYGMGHGSLDYLRKLPVRLLKLDRSFTGSMLTNPADAAIVRSTLELARHLQLHVVAEGVEDAETLEALRQLGCFAAQGFHLARPMPACEVRSAIDDIESRMRATDRRMPGSK
ncbi:MAG: EAL domain-containing protein [Lysobacteraceae bacterium]|nr:MAG: EAL domain-containing protein [Xanthomonadaceae bacterium]